MKADPRLPDFSDPNLDLREFEGKPIPVRMLGNQDCRFEFDEYAQDSRKADFHEALRHFLAADESILRAATAPLFQYYVDVNSNWSPGDDEYLELSEVDDLWKHVQLGENPVLTRRRRDGVVYVSLECECAWEPEHGLQLVFKQGQVISKLGPFDGHLSNADAYARPDFEGVIYKGYAVR